MKGAIRFVAAAAGALLALNPTPALGANCDRTCLEGLLDKYLNALVAHDPSPLPTTANVKYVENSQFVTLGTGTWKTAGKLGKYRHVFSDPQSQQVAAITTLTENGVGVIYVVRLQTTGNGTISEIETQITRDAAGAARYENMTVPEAVWLEAVPPENRISRERLIAQTDKYYNGMERNDPKGNYSFFDKDCNRLEDGLQTTNQKNGDPYGHSNDTAFASLGCEAQFQTGFLGFVTKIRDRRYPVVDEERQAVFAITIFDHNGTVRELPSVNGTSNPIPPYFDVPRTLAASEAFRLRGEKLFRIEMTLIEVPYGMRTAFDAGGPAVDLRGPGTNGTTPDPCDDACLNSILDEVLAGMLNNNTASLPLANGVRYSENGQFLALGDGLWQTLGHTSRAGVDEYAAQYTDSRAGTAVYWGMTMEQATPGVLSLRIKVVNGSITEIEAISIRAEYTAARGGTQTLMRPPLPIEWKGDSLGALDPIFKQNATNPEDIPISIIQMYYNVWEKHSAFRASFSPSCMRRDNGVRANETCSTQMNGSGRAPNGLFKSTTTIRDARYLITDAKKGVFVSVAMVDYPATSTGSLPATERVPSTYMVVQLTKVEGGFNGLITRVESLIKWMPYGYVSAWAEQGKVGRRSPKKLI